MHMHVGVPEFVQAAMMIVIFGFFWRTLSARWSENAVGKAMAYIY